MQNSAILAGQSGLQQLIIQMLKNQERQMAIITDQLKLQQQQMGILQTQLASVNKFSIASAFMELEEDKTEREAKKNNLVL